MSERLFKGLQEAQQLMDQEAFDASNALLDDMLTKRPSPYERAQILRMSGHVNFRAGNYPKALVAYESSLEQRGIPKSFVSQVTGMLGRLGLLTENFEMAIDRFTSLLEMPSQDTPDNHIMLASAFMQVERHVEAEHHIARAIMTKRTAGERLPENWLLMLGSVQYLQDKPQETRETLKTLVSLYPRERHIMNLVAVHGLLDENDAQLTLIESMYESGRITEARHLQQLVSLYARRDLPYKAAMLLQSSMDAGFVNRTVDNLERLSQYWYQAGEPDKAMAPLADAASLASDGRLYLRLAGIYLDAYRWSDAARAAERAIETGDLDEEGSAWLIQGMANTRLRHFDVAENHFRKATTFDDSRHHAGQWLSYLAHEKQIAAAMR